MIWDNEELKKIPFTSQELKDNDVYYVGHNFDDKDWEIMGIFSNLQKAVDSTKDGDFIVRCNIDVPLERSPCLPKQAWWNMGNKIFQSERFVNETNENE